MDFPYIFDNTVDYDRLIDNDLIDDDLIYNDLPDKDIISKMNKEVFDEDLNNHLQNIKIKIIERINRIIGTYKYNRYIVICKANTYLNYKVNLVKNFMSMHNDLLFTIKVGFNIISSKYIYIKFSNPNKFPNKFSNKFDKLLKKSISKNISTITLCNNIECYNQIYAETKTNLYNLILIGTGFNVQTEKYHTWDSYYEIYMAKYRVIVKLQSK
ncbi:hypothetical protein QJ850_gp633 [Acanthamoeba polyphaga mimivirus]|uniref:Uncharacterized protein n=1 Tax=Acanthamoeba polyphaga mimivirus Kroon TaxID=3069720 RepID=A0A0G2YAF9_9VIRU|nr:hypothetical protein QJ850_gp633 [Acanthamoeba polyphaga mimivirus]AKI80066.1 hypothetical protein [Acanthamoeba polyphaga mimivirus Kroon]